MGTGNPPRTARGLGRVVFPERDHSSELVFFTLGRALGQLNKQNNNSAVSDRILEQLIGIAPDLAPKKPSKPTVSPWEEAWEKQTSLQKQKFRENFELEKQWRQQWQKAQKQSSLWRQWAQPKVTSIWRQPPPWALPQNPFSLRGNNLWRQQPAGWGGLGAAQSPAGGFGSDVSSGSFWWMNELENNPVEQPKPWWYNLLKGKSKKEESEG